MSKAKCWICSRLHEPSTWAGFAVPLGALGSQIPYPQNVFINIAGAMCVCLAVLLGEKK
jgi:hypothetical protein